VHVDRSAHPCRPGSSHRFYGFPPLYNLGVFRFPVPHVALFFTTSIIFDQNALIIGFADQHSRHLHLQTVVVYRAMTEERDKRHIRDMFGKYVSPSVVAEMIENPPELAALTRPYRFLLRHSRFHDPCLKA
jgi:3-methyladenine DNA glycosylase/8-oxoguanine DNA glycosylase